MASILLIDDMDLVRGTVRTILMRAGHEVTEANDGDAGIALLRARRFDLVITDILMPGSDGGDVVMFVRSMEKRPPVLAMSGGGVNVPADQALLLARFRADAVLTKPFVNRELVALVDDLLATERV